MPARRLDVATLRPPDAILTVEGVDYLIRGDLPVETMIELLNAENLIRASGKGQDLLDAVADANELIKKLIADYNDTVPEYKFGFDEVVGIVSFLASGSFNRTAEDEIRDALLDGKTDEEITDGAAAAAAAAREVGAAKAGDDAPLASAKRSPKRSSRSAKSTAGRRNGGSASRGGRSGSTHSNSTAA